MTPAPARNRVTPNGDIVAVAGRGAWMGNRGRLHEGSGTRDIVRNHQSKAWITCVLEFRGRRVRQWAPNHYTPLFFLDEAVAFAAGRPCAECRRSDYNAYRHAWHETHCGPAPYAKDMDNQLHRERANRSGHSLPWHTLPDGVFVGTNVGPAVVVGDHLAVWHEADYAYRCRLPRPTEGSARVLTPASTVAVLCAGIQSRSKSVPAELDQACLHGRVGGRRRREHTIADVLRSVYRSINGGSIRQRPGADATHAQVRQLGKGQPGYHQHIHRKRNIGRQWT